MRGCSFKLWFSMSLNLFLLGSFCSPLPLLKNQGVSSFASSSTSSVDKNKDKKLENPAFQT